MPTPSRLRWRNRSASAYVVIIGTALILFLLLASYAMPLRFHPNAIDSAHPLAHPGSLHWFGTDAIGRDVFSRVIVSAHVDLPLALGGTALSIILGVAIGLVVSAKTKWTELIMRGVDIFQSFPLLVLAMVLVTLAGNSLTMVIIAIAIIFTPRFIRLVRAEALALRESRFIEAAVAIGGSPSRVLVRHLLPNVTGIILANAALTASRALLVIAALAYLGIGVTPPTASWGAMIHTGAENMSTGEWWVAVFPGVAILCCVLIFNQIAEALDNVLGRGARG